MLQMYKCSECGREFAYPERDYDGECRGYYDCCPYCGNDDFEELKQCPLCDIWFPDDGEDICVGCREDVVEHFKEFMNTFKPQERAFLNKYYEGEEL